MAHAAPAPGTTPGSALPDIFSARAHTIAKWAVPIVAGLVYGYWAAANNRHGSGITGWNILLGFVAAIAFAGIWMALHALTPRLRREVHALLWAAFGGCAFGFLYSQTGASVLRSVVMSLAVTAVVLVVVFYRFYTHEDAEGHRLP
ncbi:hypothetical protein ACIQNG_20715 [Streptomyces sp. NPDC091377]|uniref:hypothetical protein n=1 Tax=unclassified Streptomyces TaxID=2593676 RepID=UPI003811F197